MTPLEQARDLAQQIAEFVGKHGSEDTATFLLIEAQRSLAALSAPQGVPQQTQALWDACKKAAEAERHACSIVVWMTAMESEELDSDDLGVSGWLQEAERRVKHRTGQVPEAGDSEFRDMLAKCAGKARDALVSGDFNAARPAIAALASFADGVAYFDAVPLTAAPAAPKPAEAPALPERLMRFLLRDLKTERADLEGFLSLGNEAKRAAEYDDWIAAVESYCQQYAPAAPQE